MSERVGGDSIVPAACRLVRPALKDVLPGPVTSGSHGHGPHRDHRDPGRVTGTWNCTSTTARSDEYSQPNQPRYWYTSTHSARLLARSASLPVP
eukprot:1532370-Rhodomonas_salina.3